MSCSQFIEHDEDKSDTLVIIVNGDGTVTVDPHTFERVLKQQCRAAVSVIRFENSNESDSQIEKVATEKDETSENEEECQKVNLVVEGYYPPPPTNSKTNMSDDSVRSYTVGTPPLTQTSAEFLNLLSEGLEIPISELPLRSDLKTSGNDRCIGDSLVDAFSEMAPEQLKQVETALHSEKAKQILGHDVTSVIDTLKLNEESDDWVHLDHCYTNIYGNKKIENDHLQNILVQDSDLATILTIKVDQDDKINVKSDDDTYEEVYNTEDDIESSRDTIRTENDNDEEEQIKSTKKKDQQISVRNKMVTFKKNIQEGAKTVLNTLRTKRPINFAAKVKRKYTFKSDQNGPKSQQNEQEVPTRIVKEDEVDGVKVFKPTRNDKKLIKPFVLSSVNRGNIAPKTPLVQTKLSFNRKEEPFAGFGKQSIVKVPERVENILSKECTPDGRPRLDSTTKKNDEQARKQTLLNDKKEPAKKPTTASELFGPALFSTPDIIRKINTEEPGGFSKDSEMMKPLTEHMTRDEQTAELEKRMLAIENGEVVLDQLFMQIDTPEEKEKHKFASVSDDDKLLSDLENSENETTPNEEDSVTATPFSFNKNSSQSDWNDEISALQNSNSSPNLSKGEAEYEDDPDRLWCICNKPHGNRFMICCDACDNWFHISCVGVSKAMAEKMETNGIEWLCSSCKRKKCAKEREVKIKFTGKSVTPKLGGRQSSESISSISTTFDNSSSFSPNISTSDIRELVIATPVMTTSRRKSSSYSSKLASVQICIECVENEAMHDAMYCSAACIVKYVNNWLAAQNCNSVEPLPDDRKIIVYERKTDTVKTGLRAPDVGNIKQWLMQNPSYEIRKLSAFPIMRTSPKDIKPVQKSNNEDKTITKANDIPPIPQLVPKLKLFNQTKSSDLVYTSSPEPSQGAVVKQFFSKKGTTPVDAKHAKKSEDITNVKEISTRTMSIVKKDNTTTDAKAKEKQRQIKLIPIQPLPKPIEEQKPPQPLVKKLVLQLPKEIDKEIKKKKVEPTKKEKSVSKKTEVKRQDSRKSIDEESTNEQSAANVTIGSDSVRTNICKSLNELFVSRLKDFTDIQPQEDLMTLTTQIEEELFNIFKDTGTKYKSKYRSLLFNIKDQKNTLFRRIVERTLTPYELVRLTPEELASTELAQWREREAKHEIDMIKKTELENLNQAKVLVLKTHKGELEIESESLLPSKAVDVTVPDLQSEEVPLPFEGKEKERVKKSLPYYLNKEKDKNVANKETSSKEAAATQSSLVDKKDEKDRDKHKKQEHREKHKSRKHRRRSSERRSGGGDRHRSRSQARSKSAEKERGRRRSRSRSDGGVGEKSRRSRSSEKDRYRSRSKKRRSRSRSRKHKDKNSSVAMAAERKDDNTRIEKMADLIATMDDGISVETVDQKETSVATTTIPYSMSEDEKIAADLLSSYNSVDVDLSDMEPTSTVTIQTPPYTHSPELPSHIWKGVVIMPDVARFETTLKEVSGNCEGLEDDLKDVIDCVGRINPSTVWDYISQIKKSGNKDILVLRFEIQDDEQRMHYLSLYSYLSSKHRMAVVGNTGPAIKDFYVLPLASHCPVPQVLLPLDGPGFDEYRPHMLLAVIVRSRRKKYLAKESNLPASTSLSKPPPPPSEVPAYVPYVAPLEDEVDSFTPPHSPTSVFVNTPIPITTSVVIKNDDDEPYSPEDDEPYSPSALDEEVTNKSLDLQREMEELNRKIEEEKQQIESMSSSLPANQKHDENNELYSPEHFINTESSEVKLPANLQQLLNSFSKRNSGQISPSPGGGITLETDPIVDAYKKSSGGADKTDEDEDVDENETPSPEQSFSPPELVDEEKIEEEVVEIVKSPEPVMQQQQPLLPTSNPEPADESKTNRDPRRKLVISLEPFRCATPVGSAQPPPPGMEDEFAAAPGSSAASDTSGDTPTKAADSVISSAEATYNSVSPYGYGTATTVPPYPPPMIPPPHAMYMTAPPPVFPPHPTLPYAPMPPPPQMYIPPPPVTQVVTSVMHHDPSVIPLPVESGDGGSTVKDAKKTAEKRKATDDVEKDDKSRNSADSKKSEYKAKKHKFYSSDSKSGSDTSPSRRKSASNYESHRRGYQREDVEYSSSSGGHSSRYGHKYGGRNYHQSRSRSGYWKDDSGHSSSSHHRKYSHSGSSGSEKSSSRHGRWDSSGSGKAGGGGGGGGSSSSTSGSKVHNEWDKEIRHFESQQRDKSEHSSKKSESSKRS